MDKEKNNNFLVHGGILAIASILVRFIGMIYRVPMVNIIGREGNGYYSTAYSVYNMLLLLSSYSMPLAISKMVSSRVSVRKWKETGRVLVIGIIFGVIVGLVFGLITFFGADFFCTKVMNSPKAAIALKWMAPTVFIMAVLGVLRGFFQGLQTTIPTAISQILEQIVNALVSVGMAFVLFNYGQELALATGDAALSAAWGAAGGTIGTGAGALTALGFCGVVFYFYSGTFKTKIMKDRRTSIKSYSVLSRILVFTAVPVILSTAAYNCIDLIDTALFNGYMSAHNVSEDVYMAIWGDYNSSYLLLIHLPVAFASAIASALVPSLAAAHAEGDKRLVKHKIDMALRVTLVIAIPCAFGITAIGGNLAKVLFSDVPDEARTYLVIGGFAVVFYSLSTVTNAVLQGLNHMERPVIHALVSLAVHTLILLFLLYVCKLEIYAVIISYMIFSLVMSVLNIYAIWRISGFKLDPMRSIFIPTLASLTVVIICFAVTFVVKMFMSGRMSELIVVVVSLIISVVVYAICILKFNCFDRNQLKELPFGRKIESLASKLHLI